MSNIALISGFNDPTKAEREREAASGQLNPAVDPIVLAFYLLLQASTVSSESAVIHAKQLNQNALSQQRLNKQAAELQWYSVPHEQVNHHTTFIHHVHWTWKFWKHGGFRYTTKQTIKWTTRPNAGAVQNAESKNQQIAAERQTLSDKLTVMQQQAQVAEVGVNSITDEAMQAMQEGSNLLDILQSLTYSALLRHPPQ